MAAGPWLQRQTGLLDQPGAYRVIKPSSRRTFLENGAGALLAGGVHIGHVFYQSPGTAHEWLTWRRDSSDFAPRQLRAGRE